MNDGVAGLYGVTEADEQGWTMHELNGRPLDHYSGGKPDVCPWCPTKGELANPGWAYHDANSRPLIGPCLHPGCPYQSLPGGADHPGQHGGL